MKKRTILFLAGIFSLTLVSCGNNKEKKTNYVPPSSSDVKTDDEEELFNACYEAFNSIRKDNNYTLKHGNDIYIVDGVNFKKNDDYFIDGDYYFKSKINDKCYELGFCYDAPILLPFNFGVFDNLTVFGSKIHRVSIGKNGVIGTYLDGPSDYHEYNYAFENGKMIVYDGDDYIEICDFGKSKITIPDNVYLLNDITRQYLEYTDEFNDSVNQITADALNVQSNNYSVGLTINSTLEAYQSAKQNKDSDENSNKLYNLLGGDKFGVTSETEQKIANGETVKFGLENFNDDCKNCVAYYIILEGLDSFSTLYKPSTDFYKSLDYIEELYEDRELIFNINETAKERKNDASFLYESQLYNIVDVCDNYKDLGVLYRNAMQTDKFQELAVFADSLDCNIEDNNFIDIANYDSNKDMYANIMDYLNAQGYSKYLYTIEDSRKTEVFKTNDYAEFKKEFVYSLCSENIYTVSGNYDDLIITFDDYIINVKTTIDKDDYKNLLLTIQRSLAYTEKMPILEDYVNKFCEIPIAYRFINSKGIEYIASYYAATKYNLWTIPEYEAEFGPITDTYDFNDK